MIYFLAGKHFGLIKYLTPGVCCIFDLETETELDSTATMLFGKKNC